VNKERHGRLTRAALDHLRLLKKPPVKIRCDVAEVLLLASGVREMRHLPSPPLLLTRRVLHEFN
jgi:hypothetical protein